jgi:putative transposase
VKRGQAPGFPRFRSAERFVGWGYKEHDNGFRVALRADGKHGHANLFGIPLRQSPGRDGRAEVCRLAA